MNEVATGLSVIMPAKNEFASIAGLVRRIAELHPGAEIIVVNDASTDNTSELARGAGATVIDHPYSKGNGAAIKSGAREARGDTFVFLDGDGQHNPEDIARLLDVFDAGYDMVVGARDSASQASLFRHTANWVYNQIASWIVGHRVVDLTSGFRVVDASKFREFLYMLPNGFSYPTTVTMAFFRSGYTVGYVDIRAARREGKSHIKLLRDGVKFLLIIFRVCTLYSPLKLFFPVALLQFLLGGGYYAYSFLESGRFTNMSALLLTSAMTTFLIGLVSEQITALLFKHSETKFRN